MDTSHTCCNPDDKWKPSGFATGQTSLRRITPRIQKSRSQWKQFFHGKISETSACLNLQLTLDERLTLPFIDSSKNILLALNCFFWWVYLLRWFKALISQFMKWEDPRNILHVLTKTDVSRTTRISYLTWKILFSHSELMHVRILTNAMHVRKGKSTICMSEDK